MNPYGFQLFLLLIYFLRLKLLFDFFSHFHPHASSVGLAQSLLQAPMSFWEQDNDPTTPAPMAAPLGHRAGFALKYQFWGHFPNPSAVA